MTKKCKGKQYMVQGSCKKLTSFNLPYMWNGMTENERKQILKKTKLDKRLSFDVWSNLRGDVQEEIMKVSVGK